MRNAIDWVKRIVAGDKPGVLTLFVPQVAHGRSAFLQLVLGGGAIATLAVAGAIGTAAFVTLMMAIGIMYFLATQVLGLKLQVDPKAFYEHMQKQASAANASN